MCSVFHRSIIFGLLFAYHTISMHFQGDGFSLMRHGRISLHNHQFSWLNDERLFHLITVYFLFYFLSFLRWPFVWIAAMQHSGNAFFRGIFPIPLQSMFDSKEMLSSFLRYPYIAASLFAFHVQHDSSFPIMHLEIWWNVLVSMCSASNIRWNIQFISVTMSHIPASKGSVKENTIRIPVT